MLAPSLTYCPDELYITTFTPYWMKMSASSQLNHFPPSFPFRFWVLLEASILPHHPSTPQNALHIVFFPESAYVFESSLTPALLFQLQLLPRPPFLSNCLTCTPSILTDELHYVHVSLRAK